METNRTNDGANRGQFGITLLTMEFLLRLLRASEGCLGCENEKAKTKRKRHQHETKAKRTNPIRTENGSKMQPKRKPNAPALQSRLINSTWLFSLKLHIGEVLTHVNDIMFRIRMLSMLSRNELDSSVWRTPAGVFGFGDFSVVVKNLISRRFYAFTVHS